MEKDKLLAKLEINGQHYSVRATVHALQRMAERNIDEFVVSGNVLALGKVKLQELQRDQEEAIIIDQQSNSAVVIGFVKNTVKVITVINKSNVFVKENTRIEKL